MASLIVTEGPSAGERFQLARHRLVLIGRDDDCTFQLMDERVSRRHCQIRMNADDGRHYVIDRESRNGVLLNGGRIEAGVETLLQGGDELQIGNSLLVYDDGDSDDVLSAEELERLRRDRVRRQTTYDGD